MTDIAILFSSALGMVAVYAVLKVQHQADLRETAEHERLAGYRDAVLHDEQINRPLETILRCATNAETERKTK